jgi:hypothetical protein
MQRLAEGLLNLPRLFEVYAEDDALAFGVALLPYVKEPTAQDYLNVDLDPDAPLAPETIISMWLTSLTRSLLVHLTETVLPAIEKGKPGQKPGDGLTASGEAQLESDMEYLGNVVRALGVEWTWKSKSQSLEETGELRDAGAPNGETASS